MVQPSVPVVHQPFRVLSVERALFVVRLPPHEQPRVLRVRLPLAVGVLEPHRQRVAVAVQVARVEDVGLERAGVVRDRAHARRRARAEVGAVRRDLRDDGKGDAVEQRRRIARVVLRAEPQRRVQAGVDAAQLRRVDAAVDEVHGLWRGPAGRRDGQRVDRAPLPRLADGARRAELRVRRAELRRERADVVVRVPAVEEERRRLLR